VNRTEVRRVADRVRVIPLEAVLGILHAERDPCDRAKWHTERGVLSVTGAKFMNWHRGAGGGGAIDLVIHLEGLDFLSAVAWLAHRFPDAAPSPEPAQGPDPPRHLVLPRRSPRMLHLVVRYLVRDRDLPLSLLEPFFDAGAIYADDRANAVFLMFPEDGSPVGAEIRGTGKSPFRGMAKGSRKDLGSFGVTVSGADRVVLCESAIDALSCHVLHPDMTCLSTAGARPDPPWLAPLRIGHRVYCGFDNDATGDAMARAMIARHPDVERLRPPLKDWNELLRARR
jgi:hypothetical protein